MHDGLVAQLGFQAQTMESIAIGHSNTSNAMIFYNPTTPTHLPSTVWPTHIHYDGGIFADLYCDASPHIPEPFPPSNRVLVCLPSSTTPSPGTVTNIPLKLDSSAATPVTYAVLMDNGSVTAATIEGLRHIGHMGHFVHVSTKECKLPCSPSLQQQAIDPSHSDRHVWLASYAEEKQSLIDVNTFEIITLDQYCKL